MTRRWALAALALTVGASLVAPASADDGGGADPVGMTQRYLPRPAGVEKDMTLYFGPYTIPPGQDLNRFQFDIPAHAGYTVAVAPGIIDAASFHEPPHQEMHIHHAHWLRISNDPSYDYYYQLGPGGLSWVFGTGEELTQGSMDDRAAAEPGGPRYGMFVKRGEPNFFIYMLHNKTTQAKNVYITLKVRFVYGTADEISDAADCGPLPLLEGETCAAGDEFHTVHGKLWGSTFDVPRQASGDGTYVWPADVGQPNGRSFTATATSSGMVIAGAGHMHPNGMEVVVANLGPAGSGCQADSDADGFPGTTLFRSRKIDNVAAAAPHSEDYQMGATKPGFRAPVRVGDRITQFGVYDNDQYASYEAMSFAGIYMDRAQTPPAPPAGTPCLERHRPRLVDDPDAALAEVVETTPNHASGPPDALCGLPGYPACDVAEPNRGPGLEVDTVNIAGFAYLPGDRGLFGPAGAQVRVPEGTSLRFVNEDAAAVIRHSVTSCPWPCNGPYRANYPQPDGVFDSGKLGNLDYIDGGLVQFPSGGQPYIADDTVPVWETPANLEPGLYSYYCRIHPTMRGAFEVVAS